MSISEPHRRAGTLILTIGQASRVREEDPIKFWASLYPRRLAAAAQRPTLIEMVGRLAEQVAVNPSAMEDAVASIERMTDSETEETLRLCRETPLLVVAFARQISREQYEERS